MGGYLRLPYELRIQIFEMTSIPDVINLMQVSRELYTFATDDSLWRIFCVRYGLTHLELFPLGTTFRQVYARLLHTYGPLIGLWANDHPFKGNVIQFRYHRNGIIGETWRFPTIKLDRLDTQEMKHTPQQPSLQAFVFIEVALGAEQDSASVPHDLPDFPYICDDQGHLRLYWRVPPNADLRSLNDLTPSMRLSHTCSPFMYMTKPGHAISPHALSFFYWFLKAETQDQCMAFHTPLFYGINDTHQTYTQGMDPDDVWMDPVDVGMDPDDVGMDPHDVGMDRIDRRIFPRYYALRHPKPPPASSLWQPTVLNGLWLSANGSNGTQVLFLDYDEMTKSIRAHKITGDAEVPRGVQAWFLNTETTAELNGEERRLFGDMQPEWRIFSGIVGSNAPAHWLSERSNKPLKAVITSRDEICMRIGGTSYITRCRRYMHRIEHL